VRTSRVRPGDEVAFPVERCYDASMSLQVRRVDVSLRPGLVEVIG